MPQVLIHSRISSTVFGNIILPSLNQHATPKVLQTVEPVQTEGSLEVTDLPMILEQSKNNPRTIILPLHLYLSYFIVSNYLLRIYDHVISSAL